jgi:purine nucleosidase/pyrimidine-specific ribonucleoside hydrolase
MSAAPIPIVIDCDPGHDDAIAIMLALGSPEVDLRAVTTVSGNAPLHHTTANAIRVLDHVGRADVPVAAGADRPLVRDPYTPGDVHGETGLDGPDLPPPARAPVEIHAVDVIAEIATASDRPVTLVAIGPLTNVAIFAARHPEAAAALERVVIMGGSIGLGNVTPAAEFNIWGDPEAARRVFTSGLDVTMVGLDVTHKALFTGEQNDRMRPRGRAAKLAAELVDFYRRSHPRIGGTPIHDAVAVAQVVKPDLLTLEDCHVEVDCGPVSRGRTLVDLRGVTGREPNVRVATDVAPAFNDFMADRIASLG